MALPRECPLCGADETRQSVTTPHVYNNDRGRAFFHCDGCDVHYLYPQLTPEEQDRFYATDFEAFMSGRASEKGGWRSPEQHIQANEEQRTRRMSYIAPNLPAHDGRILEIGCSSGFMLYPLAREGHRCVGIEPSGVFSDFVRSNGIDCYGSLEELPSREDGFDVVMHFFVLEHVSDPDAFLRRQLALLRPGGRLIVEIPNVADALHTVYDIPAFERFYWSVAHHWYFSETSFRHVLDWFGHPYEIVLHQRYDLSNHMTWARDGRPGGAGRYTELLGREVEESYKAGLVRSGHCDTLIGIVTVG